MAHTTTPWELMDEHDVEITRQLLGVDLVPIGAKIIERIPTTLQEARNTFLDVVMVGQVNIEDAQHIVKCVNCHNDLLNALIRIVGNLSELPTGVTPLPDDNCNDWDIARAAITNALTPNEHVA